MSTSGVTIWLTGLSGAGKSTVATGLAARLRADGHRVEVLDGDVIRTNLSKGLGFSKADRDTNIRRIGFVSQLLTRHGVIVIVAAISPYQAVRAEVRAQIGRFVEVWVATPLAECERRDPKGLYARVRSGEISGLTGVDDPYEPPPSPELTLDTTAEDPDHSAWRVQETLARLGYVRTSSEEPS
jgi:adenylylsulfate kinase